MEADKTESDDSADYYRGIKMKDTLELSRELNQTIKASLVYQNYQAAKQKLMEYPEMFRRLREFHRRNRDIQNDESIDNPYDEVNNLFIEYDSLLHDTIVNEFIRAEQKLCLMMRTVYEDIADGLEIDMPE